MKSKNISPVASSFDEHLQDELRDPENASHFITSGVEENDPDYLKIALGRVVKAHGVAKVANLSGVGREAIYKMLSEDGNPGMSNIQEILNACGLAFKVVPKQLEKEKENESGNLLNLEKIISFEDRTEIISKLHAYIRKNGLEKAIASRSNDKKLIKLARETHKIISGKKCDAIRMRPFTM